MAPSCKLELARFSAWLRIQDGAECGNISIITSLKYLVCHSFVDIEVLLGVSHKHGRVGGLLGRL